MTSTTTELQAAREMFRGDWDANGTTSVHLPTEIATRLLEGLGWKRIANRWHAADDKTCVSGYWATEEALQVALTAIALEGGR